MIFSRCKIAVQLLCNLSSIAAHSLCDHCNISAIALCNHFAIAARFSFGHFAVDFQLLRSHFAIAAQPLRNRTTIPLQFLRNHFATTAKSTFSRCEILIASQKPVADIAIHRWVSEPRNFRVAPRSPLTSFKRQKKVGSGK
jgi:hypothetical protein